MGSRTWVKLYCDKWLDGTIRAESLETRAAFIDLLVLAGSGRWGDSGRIALTENQGFPDSTLAKIIGVTAQKWKRIKQVLIETERIICQDNDVILINNWTKYQSEYERTKPYKSTKKGTAKSTTENTVEKEKEKENYLKGFAALKEDLNKATNKVGFLVDVFKTLHPDAPAEDFDGLGGRLAGISKDHGYLLQLVWETSSRSINGSHLSYIQGIVKAKHNDGTVSLDPSRRAWDM